MENERELRKFTPIDNLSFFVDYGDANSSGFNHSHNYCELVFIISGSGTHVLNNAEHNVEAGDVFTIKPGQFHKFLDCRNIKLYNISLDPNRLNELDGEIKELEGFRSLFMDEEPLGNFPYRRLPGKKYDYIYGLLSSIIDEVSRSEEGYITLCELYLVQIIVFLSREYGKTEYTSSQNIRLAEAVAYIEKNLAQQITNYELSEISHLSLRHFTRIFKMVYNDTPANYITKLRLKTAKSLLEDDSYNISEIAGMCGFSDNNHFSKMFKRAYGVTPKRYRTLKNK